jgi:F-type H+-transporting ATPase subunit gamma
MASLKEIKLKIESTKKTKKITSAMEVVAAAKVNKLKRKIQAVRPYAESITELYADLQGSVDSESTDNPLLRNPASINSVLLIIMSSDIGLCGAYNANIFKLTIKRIEDLQAKKKDINLVTIGRKATDFIKRRYGKNPEIKVIDSHINLPSMPQNEDIAEVGKLAAKMFIEDEVQQVDLICTRFINMVVQEAQVKNFLPVAKVQTAENTKKDSNKEIVLEPDAETLVKTLTPMFLNNVVYTSLLDSMTSELASRMTAMSNASKNAQEVINNLLLAYNKARQAKITQEISEIVGGAIALTG